MASRRKMFLNMMQEKAAVPAAAAASPEPVSPPDGQSDSGGSARSLPAIRGAAPALDVHSLGSSQPLAAAVADVAAVSFDAPGQAAAAWEEHQQRPSPRAAQQQPAAAQHAASSGRATPGMRYEIYDLSTAELRAELKNCRRQPNAPPWCDWASWIADELDERVAGEDIFSAITNLTDGAEFDDDDARGPAMGGGAGAAITLDGRSDSALSTDASHSPSRRAKTQKPQAGIGSGIASGEADERRRRTAELNRTTGGARRNSKKKKKDAPGWAKGPPRGDEPEPPAEEEHAEEEPTKRAPRAVAGAQCTCPGQCAVHRQREPRPKKQAAATAGRAQALTTRVQPGVEHMFEPPTGVKLDMPPGGRRQAVARLQPAQEEQAPVSPAMPAPTAIEVEQQQARAQQLDLAVQGVEPSQAVPRQSVGSDGMALALERRSASLDKRMEAERQQVWLQQQAANSEAARLAGLEEQEQERVEAAQLAKEMEEKRRRQDAAEKARVESERQRKDAAAVARQKQNETAARTHAICRKF